MTSGALTERYIHVSGAVNHVPTHNMGRKDMEFRSISLVENEG